MESKERHGCVTAWLVLMIVLNSLTSLLYLLAGDIIVDNMPGEISQSMLTTTAVFGILNVLFSVMLLKWKKLGFWGFLITSLCVFVINLNAGFGIGQSILGLVGIAILYGVLQIKSDDKSAWSNLE
jgi:uncharacterized membrane protein